MGKNIRIAIVAAATVLIVAGAFLACGGGGGGGGTEAEPSLKLIFTANDGVHGEEPIVFDGQTVSLLKDIREGSEGSYPQSYIVYNGKLYFDADDGVNGRELWVFDGSNASMAADIHPGGAASSSSPDHFAVYDGQLYFQADDGENGLELYCFNDSTEIATLTTDIYSGGESGDPRELIAYGGKLFFSAKDGLRGTELWSYASTPSPITTLVADIRPGGAFDSSAPSDFAVYGGKLYFRARDGATLNRGRELWAHDFSSGVTTLVVDINPGTPSSNPNSLAVMDSLLFFGAMGEFYGKELWSYNESSNIATMVADINSVADSLSGGSFEDSEPDSLAVFNGKLFLEATDDGTFYDNYELWASDGTSAGTTLVADINTHPSTINTSSASFPTWLTEYDGKLYFSATDGVRGEELWAYDDSAGMATIIEDINQSPIGADSSPRFFTTFFY